MTEHYHVIGEDEVGIRLDKLLTMITSDYSRQQVQTWIKNKDVTVNDIVQKANYRCKAADTIKWEIREEEPIVITEEDIPLHIVYEDDYIIVLNKPKGMLVHPTEIERTNTLVNGLKFYTTHLADIGGEIRPGIVHRLDRDTSGVLVVAKDNATYEYLQAQFKNQSVIRIYEALVSGVIAHDQGIIKAPIGRDSNNGVKHAVMSDGKYAESHFKVLQRFENYTHVQCELITGRTHQIRVHMNYMNHPIVGDELYNDSKTLVGEGQALFAKQLQFIHPETEESMTFTVEQPLEFKNLLQKLPNMS